MDPKTKQLVEEAEDLFSRDAVAHRNVPLSVAECGRKLCSAVREQDKLLDAW